MVEFINQEYDMRDNVVAMIFSGVFERHPTLKVGLVEYEVSWAPYLLHRMDVAYQEIRRPERFGGRRFGDDMLPSDIFQTQHVHLLSGRRAGYADAGIYRC